MASGIGLLLILFGAFVMTIGYTIVSDCLTRSFNSPCWSPEIAFGFYAGAFIAAIGVTVLVGQDVIRFLSRSKGSRA